MESGYQLKKRNITEFDTSLDMDVTGIQEGKRTKSKHCFKNPNSKNETNQSFYNFSQILINDFNDKRKEVKFYQEFEKKVIVREAPEYIIQNDIHINYPEGIKNFINQCDLNEEKYYLDVITKLNLLLVFSRNKIYFYKFKKSFDSSSTFFKELEFNIANVTVAKIRKNKDLILLVYSQNCVAHFFALNPKNEFLFLNLQKITLDVQFTYYSYFSNSLIIIDKKQKIKNIKLKISKDNFEVLLVEKKEDFFRLKKIKQFTVKQLGQLKDFFNKSQKKFEYQYIIKEFQDYLFVLEKKIQLEQDQKFQIAEKLKILQFVNKSFIFIREIDVYQIFSLNIVILQNLLIYPQIQKRKIFINDFFLNSKYEFVFLLNNKMELKINASSLIIKKLKSIKFLDNAYKEMILDCYQDEKTILGFYQGKSFLVIKNNISCYALDDFSNNESWSVFDLGINEACMYNLYKLENLSFLKNKKDRILISLKEGFRVFDLLTEIDFVANYVIMEVFYSKYLHEGYFYDFFRRKKFIGLKTILKQFMNTLLINKNSYFPVIVDFISLLICNYKIEVKEFLHENLHYDFLNFQIIACKYFNLFSEEMKNKINKDKKKLEKKKKILTQKESLVALPKEDLKKDQNFNEGLILSIILNSIQTIKQEMILTPNKNKEFSFNNKLALKIGTLKKEITSVLKCLYFFENVLKKNEEYIIIINEFVEFIKDFSFFNKMNLGFLFENEIFSKNIMDFVQRITKVLDFLIFLKDHINEIDTEYLSSFGKLTLKDLFFYTVNEDTIKNCLVFNFDKINQNDCFFETFISPTEIQGLQEYQKFRTVQHYRENLQTESFIEKMKGIDFYYLKEFIGDFWERESLVLFLKLILEKLNQKEETQISKELMKVFIFATLINLLSEIQKQRDFTIVKILKHTFNKTKTKLLDSFRSKKKFNLADSLTNLNNDSRLKLLKTFIEELLKNQNDSIRERTIFYLLEHNESDYVKNSEYENKIKDLIKVFTINSEMFENKIGLKNGYYMINFLIKNKKFYHAFEIILKILQNHKIDEFLSSFKFENFFNLLTENFEENFLKWKKMNFLNLEELQIIICQAKRFKQNIETGNPEVENKFGILKQIEVNLKLNILIKKELIIKKKYFQRVLKLDKLIINKEVLNKILSLLDFEIFFINLNPKFEKHNIMERIIKNNKLYITMFNLPKFICSAPSFDYNTKVLTNLIKFYGRLNNSVSISKISNHFLVPELFQNLEFLKNMEIEKKKILLNDFQKLQLIYPYNLPDEIHEIMEMYIVDGKCQVEDLKRIIYLIETFNMNNEYFKILIEQMFSFEKNYINSQTLWHLFNIWKKFDNINLKEAQKDFVPTPKIYQQNLNIIFKYLEAYYCLSEQMIETKDESKPGEENLKFKFVYNYLVLFDFLLMNIQRFLEKREPFEIEKRLISEFVRNFELFANQLNKISDLTPNLISQNTFFFAYFKFKEKIQLSMKTAKFIFQSKKLDSFRN